MAVDHALIDRVLLQAADAFDPLAAARPRGVVLRVGDGVALIGGLPGAGCDELLRFDSGALGMVFDLREDGIGALLLTARHTVSAGQGVTALGGPPDLAVGPACLGRLIDPLGRPLDEGPPLPARPRLPLFRPAPDIIERTRVERPFHTGVTVVDAAIPIGRGQRELIIGDRNTGKTAVALDILAAQRPGDVACVYVVIGQPMSRILAVRDDLQRRGCLSNTVLVAAEASAAPGMQYLAPYAGASAAEWFRDSGADAVVVYDDLTKHADVYRELALLLDRPPGREAYPGDIFHIHAELLERAAAVKVGGAEGSVTAFPLVETTDSDISAYIPTNLISITDGQIYLDTGRFERDLRPAVDIGLSVSRIGSVAQPPALRRPARNLKVLLSRLESLEALSRVGLEIDAATRQTLVRGRILRELLRQHRFSPRGTAEQVVALTAVGEGLLDAVAPERCPDAVASLLDALRRRAPDIAADLDAGREPKTDYKPVLAAAAREVLGIPAPGNPAPGNPASGNPAPGASPAAGPGSAGGRP